ncbi:hypothetical protein PR048_026694 [Dryococelus australis]|uniref:Uncharacterized protein n=1 Tax=Dryococelus australis TaxID=614101 RepID=A0ABQ9GM25_9NEOP|nr:hypothetical protein PR048_026694 [Dryococelus australis]
MDLVDNPHENLKFAYYLLSHGVIKENSTTTRLHVIFNASPPPPPQMQNCVSLNDMLLTGPKLQTDISEILQQFHILEVVFTADITQMYRQILVQSEHQDYQWTVLQI